MGFKKKTAGWDGGGGRGKQHTEKGSGILLDSGPGQPPPAGMLGCVAGRKGPGKQSSLAFLQSRRFDLQDPCEFSHATGGVVRGVLPLELRDLQNGSSAGCLILGPDGEIVQLSLYNITQNPPLGEDGTGQQALQVLSTEGDTLPWVIVLQPECTHTEGGVELNADDSVGDTEHQQHTHKLFDSNVCSAISITDAAVTQKKTKSTAATMEIQKKPEKDAKNNVGMPPLRELVEELTGGNTQEEKELTTTGRHQPSHRAGEATTEEAVNRRTTKMKRKDAEEAAATIGRRETKNVKSTESDGQKTSRRSKEGRWQRLKGEPNDQPIRSQKQAERTNRDEATGLPSQKKKRRDVEGERGREKTKEEREESPERTRRMKKRRGGPKQKELIVGNNEEEKEEIHQEMEEESQLESSKSTTQTHNNKTKTHSEEDTNIDRLSTADYLSGVRSETSLRSSKALFNRSSSNRSSSEGAKPTSAIGHASTRGRLSSCSTVMVTEEQLILNPVKPESSTLMRRRMQEEATALRLAERAERRRQEVERKRREREEQEREQMEERLKSELEEERRKRAEQLRLKKLAEEEEEKRREEVEEEQAKREEARREREKRRQEERRRQMERLQRMREEEEQRRKAELERFQLEEQRRHDEERKKLQEMNDKERMEYLQRKEEEEEERRKKEEECKRREEEAAILAAEEARLQAELHAREMALLQQRQLAFQRGLAVEAGGLERTQAISRPWTFSYFPPLHLLGLSRSKAETTT